MREAESVRINPGPGLTVRECAAVREELLAALAAGPAVELDLGAVEELDVAGLQVILGAARSARARGRLLSVIDLSGAARSAIIRSGLAPSLEEVVPATLGGGLSEEEHGQDDHDRR